MDSPCSLKGPRHRVVRHLLRGRSAPGRSVGFVADQVLPDAEVITVFLVEDHELVRRGVAEILDDEADLSVVGQASSVAAALARVPALRPDVAVLDVRLPDG